MEPEISGRVLAAELGSPKYGRAIWKLTGAPRPIFRGAGVSRPRYKGLGGTGISPISHRTPLGKYPEAAAGPVGLSGGVPSSSRRTEQAGVGAGGERSRVADTQPGRVVCCGQAVGSVSLFLDIHLGIEPRDMQTQQQALTVLGAPMSHVHPPIPRSGV